jgi:molecular chaperone DnaK (HSP70)
LYDFGASGTNITLADAHAGLAIIGDTVRYPDFSGDLIDQSLLNHVIAGIADARDSDPASTAAVGSARPAARRVQAGQGDGCRPTPRP